MEPEEDPDSDAPFDLWEVDEAIDSQPPVRAGLGPLGQLLSAVLMVGALILLFMGGALVVAWLL